MHNMSTPREPPYHPGTIRPGNDRAETMSVAAYSEHAKKVSEDVQRVLEAGWANTHEKRLRGNQIHSLLSMAAVVRLQSKAIEHGGMSDSLKKTIKPPDFDPRLMASTGPAVDYIKTSLVECKDRILLQHKEIQSLRKALKDIQKKVVQDHSDDGEVEVTPSSFWDDEHQIGEILGELNLDDSESTW